MSAYEELLARCAKAMWTDSKYNGVAAVLAEVLRTLETVTPEMDDAWDLPGWEIDETAVARTFVAMLRASPITPP